LEPGATDVRKENANGVPSSQPKVARHELPWEIVSPPAQTPTGVASIGGGGTAATPLGLETFFLHDPRVGGAPCVAPNPWG